MSTSDQVEKGKVEIKLEIYVSKDCVHLAKYRKGVNKVFLCQLDTQIPM